MARRRASDLELLLNVESRTLCSCATARRSLVLVVPQSVVSGVSGGACAEDHRHPQVTNAPSTGKLDVAKSALRQQRGQGLARPELDVPAVPKGGEVRIHCAGSGQCKILQVAVVWCRDHQASAWLQHFTHAAYEQPGVVEVLNDL